MPIRELTRLARKRVKEILETVAGVGDIKIVGEPRARDPHPGRSREARRPRLSIFDVESALRKQNLELPGGSSTEEPRSSRSARWAGSSSAADFGAIPIDTFESTPILVRDVARVADADEEQRCSRPLDGAPCISLADPQAVRTPTPSTSLRRVRRARRRDPADAPAGMTVTVASGTSRASSSRRSTRSKRTSCSGPCSSP